MVSVKMPHSICQAISLQVPLTPKPHSLHHRVDSQLGPSQPRLGANRWVAKLQGFHGSPQPLKLGLMPPQVSGGWAQRPLSEQA